MPSHIHGDYELKLVWADTNEPIETYITQGLCFAIAQPNRPFGISVVSRSGREVCKRNRDGTITGVHFKPSINDVHLGCRSNVGNMICRAYVKRDDKKVYRDLVFSSSDESGVCKLAPPIDYKRAREKFGNRLDGIAAVTCKLVPFFGETPSTSEICENDVNDPAFASIGQQISKKQQVTVFGSTSTGETKKRTRTFNTYSYRRRGTPFGNLVVYFDDLAGLEMRGIFDNPAIERKIKDEEERYKREQQRHEQKMRKLRKLVSGGDKSRGASADE